MALDLDPNFAPAHWVRGMAFTAKGQNDSAIAEERRAGDLNPNFRGAVVEAYAAGGRTVDVERTLASLSGADKRWAVARASRFNGNRDAAIRGLELAIDEHTPWIGHIRGDPAYEYLVSDPRYQALLRRIGLPPRPPARRAGTDLTPPP